MAPEAKSVPALPVGREIVTNEVLASRQYATNFLTRGFGGQSDPTVIWTSLINDSQDAYRYMRELEEKDEDVSTMSDMLKLAVLSQPWEIVPADESSKAAEVAEFIKGEFNRLGNLHEKLDAILDGVFYGVSVSETLYDVSEGQVRLVDIKDKPQEFFMFNEWTKLQNGQLRFLQSAWDRNGILVPEEQFIVYTYRGRAGNRRGRPLFRAVFWPSWFKRQAVRFWLRFAEKGVGVAAVKYNGSTQGEQDKALEAAESIMEHTAVAVPQNMEIITELLTTARSTDPKVYQELVLRNSLCIARRMMGQTLTTYGSEQGKGSLALGEVHLDMFNMKWQEIARSLECAVNAQLVYRMVLWEYGLDVAEKLCPKFNIDKSVEEDLKTASEVDKNLQSMGLDMPASYIREKYGVPEVEEGDEALKPRERVLRNPNDPFATEDEDDTEDYSEDEQRKNQEHIRKLMRELKKESFDRFAARIQTLVEEVNA
jgi:phage gp29-like protein